MAQQTKTPGDQRYSDESLDPYQQEADAIFNRPDMQALDDQGDAIAREYEGDGDSDDSGEESGSENSRPMSRRESAREARRAAEKKEWDDAANLMNYGQKGDKNSQGQKSNSGGGNGIFNKKNAIRGGLAGGAVGLVLAIFGFLSPFKLPALMQVVTDVTGQRVEQITTHRAKVILARAILTKFGAPGGVVITGDGPVSSLIATLRTNKFEDKLKAKGIEIVDANKQGVRIKVNGNFVANGGRLTSDRLVLAALEEQPLSNKIIKDMVKEEIPTWRWMKRAKFATWLRLKYAIPKFGTKKSTETDKEAKLADIQEDRLNGRYEQYANNLIEAVDCLMGEANCPVNDPDKDSFVKNLRDKAGQKASAVKDALKSAVQEQTKLIINDTTKSLVVKINTQLEKLLIKKFATKAIPIIGWIDLAATLDHIAWNALENDYIAAIPSHYRAISYAQMYGEWIGYGDQNKAGDMDNDVLGMLATQLNGAETAKAFNYLMGDASRGVPVKIPVDENKPSVVKQGWEQLKNTPQGWYYKYVTHNVMDAYYNTIGGGGLLGALGDFVSDWISRGIAFATSWVPEEWTQGIQAYLADVMSKLFVTIGMAADPLDTGADLFNDIYAGGDVSYNTYCKEMGCRKLTDAQVVAQNRSIALERAQDIQDKGWAYALFSPDSTKSITNQLAMTLPSSLTPSNLNLTDGIGQLATLITSTPGRLMGTTAKADQEYVNLNGVYNYGALASDLDKPVASEAESGEECPAVVDGEYNNCNWDKKTAESMICSFTPESDACNFTTYSSAQGNISAMTYNILGSTHENDGGQSWQTRIGYAIDTVKESQPDIIGFQEVSGADGQRGTLKNRLADTYDMYPYDGEGDDATNRPIYWNKQKYELVSKTSKGTYEYPRYGNPSAKFPWVQLRHIQTGTDFFVFNTHTAAGNKDSRQYYTANGNIAPPEARAEQTEKMAIAIQRIVPAGTPTILVGDYNSTCEVTPNDRPMELEDIPCKILERAGFIDAGVAANAIGKAENYEYNTSHGAAGRTVGKRESGTGRHIDHVFYSRDITVASWENIVTEATKNASDHTPVIAGLNIPGLSATSGTGSGDISGDDASALGYKWPISKADFKGLTNCYAKPGHTGIDFSAAVGTKVRAAKDGTVVATDPGGGSDAGKYIIIKHDDGHWTNYQHNSKLMVSVGDAVKAGQVISLSGNTGYSTGPHLHFSVTTQQGLDSRRQVAYSVNPVSFMPKDRSASPCRG